MLCSKMKAVSKRVNHLLKALSCQMLIVWSASSIRENPKRKRTINETEKL